MVPIVTRAQWGAQFAIPGGRHVAPSARRWFVVHWPGTAVGADERAVVRAIERSHRVGQGWQAAPGYNFLVGRSGTIYEGCGRDVRGIHSPPRNTDGWGVCVMIAVGEQPPQAALNATRALYNWLNVVAGRTLGMAGHNTHFATACPGPALSDWVRRGMPATGGGTTPPVSPERGMTVIATGSYPDGRMLIALTATDNNVYVTEQAAVAGTWSGTGGRMVGGPIPVPGPVSVSLMFRGDTPSLFIQSANPPGSGNGDVFTSWRQADRTWAPWTRIS